MDDLFATDDLLTTEDLCKITKLTRMTIERYRKQGMPFVVIGKRNIRFEKEPTLNWLKNRSKLSQK